MTKDIQFYESSWPYNFNISEIFCYSAC